MRVKWEGIRLFGGLILGAIALIYIWLYRLQHLMRWIRRTQRSLVGVNANVQQLSESTALWRAIEAEGPSCAEPDDQF